MMIFILSGENFPLECTTPRYFSLAISASPKHFQNPSSHEDDCILKCILGCILRLMELENIVVVTPLVYYCRFSQLY